MTARARAAVGTARRRAAVTLCLAAALGAGACAPTLPAGPEVSVDANGFFASVAPERRLWHAGAGVVLLVPRGPGDPLRGRLDPRSDPVVVLADDGFAPHRLRVQAAAGDLSGEVRGALAAALADRPGALAPVLVRALREPEPEPPVTPQRATPPAVATAAAPPAPGAPLAAWAPREFPFVWVRSVEAGYRFASLLDELAGRVLAAGGDARDAATLRLTLHDLLLPTIWRANPGGTKGVSECGIVLEPPLRRGRLRLAVIFRVVDPELHDMETRAGIALESGEGHLWRPPDDPFPERRGRRNSRRRVADVEIVATDAALADVLAAGVERTHAGDAETLAFLIGPGDGPGTRAFAAVFPEETAIELDAPIREGIVAGAWALLAPHFAREPDRLDAPPASARSVPLRRAEVRTDVTGAFAHIDAGSETAARWWAARLTRPPEPDAGACGANRADLEALVLLDGVRADPIERSLEVLGCRPVCPAGGTYRVHPVTRAVACSAHGGSRELPSRPESRPWPVTEVTTEGTDVVFRVVIDWRRRE